MKAANDNRTPWYVYTLTDSRTPDAIRYIGITYSLKKRLASHLRGDARPNHRTNWINSVLADGADIVMSVINQCTTCDEAKTVEIQTIAKYKSRGFDLVNSTAGGDGLFSPSKAVREKISRANRGRKSSNETRAKISAAQVGKVITDECRAKISKALSGKPKTKEHSERVGAAQKGKVISEATRVKMSQSAKRIPKDVRLKIAAPRRGVGLSNETKAKMSFSRMGRIVSDETRRKLSSTNGRRKPSHAGIKGVTKIRDKWQARITLNGKRCFLGLFDTKDAAARAYDSAAYAAWGDDCYLNFPDKPAEH